MRKHEAIRMKPFAKVRMHEAIRVKPFAKVRKHEAIRMKPFAAFYNGYFKSSSSEGS